VTARPPAGRRSDPKLGALRHGLDRRRALRVHDQGSIISTPATTATEAKGV